MKTNPDTLQAPADAHAGACPPIDPSREPDAGSIPEPADSPVTGPVAGPASDGTTNSAPDLTSDLPPDMAPDLSPDLARATGSASPAAQEHLLMQLSGALIVPHALDGAGALKRVQAALALLAGIAPRGEAESLLAVQMVAVHEAAMDALARAAHGIMAGPAAGDHAGRAAARAGARRAAELNLAARLMALYVRQLEALTRKRRKGRQIVTVEHVHVEAGGRAIVGHVAAPSDGTSNAAGTGDD
jgi:hypothetical protein